MQVIYKYPIEIEDRQVVRMPKHADILSAQMQQGQLCLWALVNTEAENEPRHIFMAGTGNPLPDGHFEFIATLQTGPFVWHIFEEFPTLALPAVADNDIAN